ncbi:MAG TPA: hypothetical protein VKR43_04355 [Bryobacteraceae bacterium]|nr:hypothetical protein [Bryobacteraceae bacterium]
MKSVVWLFLIATVASAHDVTTQITWSREVSRLVMRHCYSCHPEFKNYQQAQAKAKAIGKSVLEHTMPPSEAVKGFGDIRNDGALTQEQIEIVTRWVQAGAPEGDAAVAPKDWKPSAFTTQKPEKEWTGTTLDSPMTVTAIRAKSVPAESVKVLAQKPDGSLVPLIWFYRYNPKFERTYYLRKPVALPAGTKIVTSAPQTVVALLH